MVWGKSFVYGAFPVVLPKKLSFCLTTSVIFRRFLFGASDSDSDDGKRVVRSAKDRRFDELRATSDEIKVTHPAANMMTFTNHKCTSTV